MKCLNVSMEISSTHFFKTIVIHQAKELLEKLINLHFPAGIPCILSELRSVWCALYDLLT